MKNSRWFFALLWGGVILPWDLSQWQKTSFPFKNFPSFSQEDKDIRISSKEAIGGYAFRINPARKWEENSFVEWSWEMVKTSSRVPQFPIQKEVDDFPVRVGLVFSGGESPAKIPYLVKKKIAAKDSISHIVYYSPVRAKSGLESQCGKSPHNKYSIYCLLPFQESKKKVKVFPWKDLKKEFSDWKSLTLQAIWVLQDTDDTKESMEIKLSPIQVFP